MMIRLATSSMLLLSLALAGEGRFLAQKKTPGGGSMPGECKKYANPNVTMEEKRRVQKCEVKKGFVEKTIQKLQAGDPASAERTVSESFQECAKWSKACAELLAPRVVQKMRFAGLAVSKGCAREMSEVQSDPGKMKKVAECEEKEEVAKEVLEHLTRSNVTGAVGVAEQGLEECVGFESEKHCESQLAPVVVNQLVRRAMEETQMVPIFVAAASVALPKKGPAAVSLLSLALSEREISRPQLSLLETDRTGSAAGVGHSSLWVSKLLMDPSAMQ